MSDGKHRILVVDDEPRNVRLVLGMLYSEPYDLIPAYGGAEALQLINDNPPDLILLDVMMPNVTGFEVCRRVKNDPLYRMIPVVMVTALSDVSDRIEAMQAGADDFLSKPVDAAELIVRVRSLLRIRQLYTEVERVTHHRLQVMAGIAHDIRSPLNALALSIELLADRVPTDERLNPLWTNITTCIDHIRILSNDLMHYYQIEAGEFQLTYSTFSIAALFASAAPIVMPIAAQKGISLKIDPVPPVSILGDENSLLQVILNLLTNAVKYTNPGGHVTLCAHDLAAGEYKLPAQHVPPVEALPLRGIVIEVTDTGRGIAPDAYDLIFSEFGRIKGASEPEGVGLGLAVSQRLVELHRGAIWFTSELGQGSTFSFYIPA